MESRSVIWIAMLVGSTIGGFIPALWGANFLSISSVFCSALGGLAGIWIGFKIMQ